MANLNEHSTDAALKASLKRGSLGGWVASGYCLVFGTIETGRGYYALFSSPVTAILAMVFGAVSLMLLFLLWRAVTSDNPAARVTFLEMFAKNFCIVFALVLVVLTFTSGIKPGIEHIIKLVFQLALVWIVYSSVRFLSQAAKGQLPSHQG